MAPFLGVYLSDRLRWTLALYRRVHLRIGVLSFARWLKAYPEAGASPTPRLRLVGEGFGVLT